MQPLRTRAESAARPLTTRFAMVIGTFALAAAAPPESPAPPPLTYADIADVALAAPLAAHVRLKDAVAVKPDRAPGLAAGSTRFYVAAEVVSLIRASSGVPGEIAYLVDLPVGADGKPQRLRRKSEYVLFGRAVPGRVGEIQLAAPDAQFAYSPDVAERLRTMLREAVQPDAAPAIVGIGRAFHAPGALPGESETQIFLQAADGRPVSLSILRRPGEEPRWGIALSEIAVDTAAAPPPDTLLWYRLACTLPPTLPPQSLAEAEPEQHAAIRADYQLVLQSLGPCARTRRPS